MKDDDAEIFVGFHTQRLPLSLTEISRHAAFIFLVEIYLQVRGGNKNQWTMLLLFIVADRALT